MAEIKKNYPKLFKISKTLSRIQKVLELFSKSCYCQKVRDISSKSYCWSPNLLGTRCPGAATICSSGAEQHQHVALYVRYFTLHVCVVCVQKKFEQRRTMSHIAVRCSQTSFDGTNVHLAKFFPVFWCGIFLYDQN